MFTRPLTPTTVLLTLGFLAACGGGNSDTGTTSTGGQPGAAGSGTTAAGKGGAGGSVSTAAGSGGMPTTNGGGGSTATGGVSTGGGTAGAAGQAPSGGAGAGGTSAGGTGGSGGGAAFPDPSTFVCNGILGVSVTDDWFEAGFETAVDNAKWQLRWRSLAFVEEWADPQNGLWSEPLVSACANGSTNPDRVLFVAVNWMYTTAEEWEPQLTAVVENIKAKYSAVKEIDIMTILRAPNNMICGDPNVSSTKEQVTTPALDAAIAATAAKYPTLVRAAPPFYAPSCATFITNSPHYPDAATKTMVAKVYSDYYVSH